MAPFNIKIIAIIPFRRLFNDTWEIMENMVKKSKVLIAFTSEKLRDLNIL